MSVVWLTGPAGVGKSTLGRALRALVNPVSAVALLDEDDVKDSARTASDWVGGHGRAPAAQLSQTARVLAQQGLVVVVTSSDEDPTVLTWNRSNLPGYREVRMQASPATIRHRQHRDSIARGFTDSAPLEREAAPGPPARDAAPLPEPDLTIEMDEPEPPELLAFRVAVLIPEFVVAAAGAAGQTRHWPGRHHS
jgi:hypothetical protein